MRRDVPTHEKGISFMSDEDADGPREPCPVVVLDWAKLDGRRILTEREYWYVVPFVQRLGEFGDLMATADLDLKQIGDFWELRLKGGFLGKKNIRVYFAFVRKRREVVVLMTYKKEEDRRVSPSILITLDDRLDDYLAGCARVAARHRGAIESDDRGES
jgi:hypothetical protein